MGRQELFHGTVANIKGKVRPAGRGSPKSNFGATGYEHGQRSDEHAFATEDEHNAWNWAETVAARREYKEGGVTQRARVYKVDSSGDAKPGVFHPKSHADTSEKFPEWVSKKGFKVKDRLDTMPGRQGTFPQENWNAYRSSGYTDANHPGWAEVHHGSRAAAFADHPVEAPRTEIPGQTELPLGKQWQG